MRNIELCPKDLYCIPTQIVTSSFVHAAFNISYILNGRAGALEPMTVNVQGGWASDQRVLSMQLVSVFCGPPSSMSLGVLLVHGLDWYVQSVLNEGLTGRTPRV